MMSETRALRESYAKKLGSIDKIPCILAVKQGI